MKPVIVSGSFDDLRFPQVRFLQEAARLGRVHVLLWPDELVAAHTGQAPRFPLAERQYYIRALRYVSQVSIARPGLWVDEFPYDLAVDDAVWAVTAADDSRGKRVFCASLGLGYQVIADDVLNQLPQEAGGLPAGTPGRKKVIVTGCYDWLHSGHVRFFEEASQLGDLYVVVGHDENIRLLKGAGHPLFPAQQRRLMVSAIRYVHAALISSGSGWMDAAPEIEVIRPDIYVVNEDGDKPEKHQFCSENGIKYEVLRRLPAPGLSRRESTMLRGF